MQYFFQFKRYHISELYVFDCCHVLKWLDMNFSMGSFGALHCEHFRLFVSLYIIFFACKMFK